MLTFSVVINTCNRAKSLDETLRSMHRQSHPQFEVVVVNGPSTDDTENVLALHSENIRIGHCAQRNISVSRNVGIRMAQGDIVAFIDDDAIADEDWLKHIESSYASSDAGAVGGFVYSHTGYDFQTQYQICNRIGDAVNRAMPVPPQLCFPGTLQYPHMLGTNATFRRDVLLELGGFDEEYEYFLDETDVCVRLIDAGFSVHINPRALVYHRFLPSHIRGRSRVPTNFYPIFKNKWYFSVRHASGYLTEEEISHRVNDSLKGTRTWLLESVALGLVPRSTVSTCDKDLAMAEVDGKTRALTQPPRLMHSPYAASIRGEVTMNAHLPGVIKQHPSTPDSGRLTICLLTQQYPPGVIGGVGRMSVEMARGLSARGHRVHVLTRSRQEHSTVDWEDGIWIHRIAIREDSVPPPGTERLAHLWAYAEAMLKELRRIQTQHEIDIVDAPLWDGEAWAVLADGTFRTVISLETPLKVSVEVNPSWRDNRELHPLFEQQAAVERYVITRATAVRALTHGVVGRFESDYGLAIDPLKLHVMPLGIADPSDGVNSRRDPDGFTDVLFVGRLESRKGVDVLLEVIPQLCRAHKQLRFIITGEDSEFTIRNRFHHNHAEADWLPRVMFTGPVPEAELYRRFAECDIFVAPSRFESFGLIFLEAMAFSKPLIGCNAGGMPEVIDNGVTGLLAEPGDAFSLYNCLEQLIISEELRRQMGRAGRQRFDRFFSRDRMIQDIEALYRRLVGSCFAPV